MKELDTSGIPILQRRTQMIALHRLKIGRGVKMKCISSLGLVPLTCLSSCDRCSPVPHLVAPSGISLKLLYDHKSIMNMYEAMAAPEICLSR